MEEKTDSPATDGVGFATVGAVDRLGAEFCAEPQDSERLASVQGYRAFRMQCLATTLRMLDACAPPTQSIVSVRLKRLDSIRRKITRPNANFRLGTLDDVVGDRVICQSVSDVIALSSRIESSSHFYRIKNYIKTPATTGYRGIHHIMRFDQSISAEHSLAVRYEIQARTYLQHRWAVWSEAHGEKAKIGQADVTRQEELRSVASDIAGWEEDNPTRAQDELLRYSGVRTIAVCWRPPYGPSMPFFHDDVRAAVSWLNHLEAAYPAQRENALLLVGVAERADIEGALRLTHPLYLGAPAVDPTFYIPSTFR